MGRDISLDEVIEHFTLDGDEKELLRNKAGGRLGFAMMLKYLLWRGRFPRGRHEIPDDAIAHVARQIGVSAGDMGFYDVASCRSHQARRLRKRPELAQFSEPDRLRLDRTAAAPLSFAAARGRAHSKW